MAPVDRGLDLGPIMDMALSGCRPYSLIRISRKIILELQEYE